MCKLIYAALTVLATSSCTNLSREVAEPDSITLQQAMFDVGESFGSFERGRGPQPIGLLPCEIDVTFNVSSRGIDTTEVGLESGKQLVVTEPKLNRTTSFGGTLGYSGVSEGLRGNQVVVKLRHIQCLPSTVLANSPGTARSVRDDLADIGAEVLISRQNR